MERQAKDGTVYKQVGPDDWEPVTRQAKDGTVFKKVGADDWEPLEVTKAQDEPRVSAGRSALEGFANSSSFGTLPYLKAAAEKYIVDPLAEAIHGVPAGNESYESKVEKAKAQGKEIKEANPNAALVGEVAGFIAPGAAMSKAVGKGLHAAAGSSRLAAAAANSGNARRLYQAASKAKELGNVARAAKLTAAARGDLALQGLKVGAESAALGALYTPESGFSDLGARAENAAVGFGVGAVMPAGLRAAGHAVKAPAKVGKKLLSAMGGVSEDVIERYLKNPERINNAQTFDELYEQVSGIVRQIGDDLEKAKVGYDAAKAQLDDVASGIKNSRIEGKERALEQVQQARTVLDQAFSAQKQSIAQRASPSAVEPLVSDAISGLKKTVSKGSGEAVESLGNEVVPIESVRKTLVNNIKELSARGSDAAKRAAGKLAEYEKLIFSKGGTNAEGRFDLPAKEIKRLIQDLDSDISSWNAAGGSFDDAYNASLKSLRGSLDEQLKASNPTYKAKMAEVAENTRLLSQASEKFGRPDRALNRLGGLDRNAAKYDLETLKAVVQKQGGELPKTIDEMVQAQRTLKSPTRLESLKQSLPEQQALRDAEMKMAAAKRLAKPKFVTEAIRKSAATFNAQSAKAKLEAQKEVFNRFKSFGEQGAEGKLKQVALGRKHAENVLRELSEYADEDLVEAVKAAKDASAFTKTMFNGSRNVNLWSVLGALGQSVTGRGGVGAAAGGVFGGPVGIAFGAVVGSLMDVYGPKVTKKILDGVIKIKGPITTSALSKLDIPQAAKTELINTFRSSVLSGRAASFAAGAEKLVADKDQPKKGPDKWAQTGFEKLLNHSSPEQREVISQMKETLLKNPKTRTLLINASDLKPGSKAMDQIFKEISKRPNRDVTDMGVE